MLKDAASHTSAVARVYVIVALFLAIILGLVLYFQFQTNAAVGIRVFIGGEGLWAKAQKDAVLSLVNFGRSGAESDYQSFLHQIRVPLSYQTARQELEKPYPNLAIVREACRQAGLHPVDIEYAIPFYLRFRRSSFISSAVVHWTHGDQHVAELIKVAEQFHAEVAGGRASQATVKALEGRLADINGKLRVEEDQFSATLAEASRWASDLSRSLTYTVGGFAAVLGIILSWSIIGRIRHTEDNLLESERRYRSIFEGVSDAIYTVTPNGRFTSISPSWERMTGWSPAGVVGTPYTDAVHPDDVPLAQRMLRQTLAGSGTANFEMRIRRSTGDFIDTEHSVVPLNGAGSMPALLGIARDISERKRMELELRESEQRLRAVLGATVDGILVADMETGKFVIGNRAICDMLGYEPEELLEIGVANIHPRESLPDVWKQFENQGKREIRVARNVPVKSRDGQIFYADINSASLSLRGRVHLVGVFHDVTERKRAEEEISQLASTDSLTGIANRRTFMTILERDIERNRRHGAAFSIIMYDLDRFKRINDTFGHPAGDQVLRTATAIVRRNIRSADVAARWGGEEFMVLVADGDLAVAVAVAEKLRQAIASHHFGEVGSVTASFGVTTCNSGEQMSALLKRVDEALYSAKANGRNRVESIET